MNKRLILLLILLVLLTGCAAQKAYRDGLRLIDEDKPEAGLAQIETAVRLDPDNQEYRVQYFQRREVFIYRWLLQVETAKAEGRWDDAQAYLQRVLKIDPENTRAKVGISGLQAARKHAQQLDDARVQFDKNDLGSAERSVRQVLMEAPSDPAALKLKKEIDARKLLGNRTSTVLRSKLDRPITIEFKDATIRAVFESISRVAGINVIFDKEVRPDLNVNLFVRDAKIEDVIRFVLVTNQLEQRILNSNTLFIYPNTPQKQKDFQELQLRNFYLTNANAKEVAAMLKSLVKAKDIYIDEKLNLIVMRDTPDSIRVAERIIAAQDIAEPEVMLEVEVLEVGSNLLDTIGIQYPSQISAGIVGAAGTPGTVTLPEFLNRNAGLVRVSMSDPALTLNLLHQSGDTNLLANPKIRVKNHEKANVHIGDKVPVITNTATATGLVSQSINYLDVGLKLDVEPTIYLDGDVGIKVGLEVSSIAKQIPNTNGSLAYQIGTRKASTSLRLKDGETQILAGLINKEDRRTSSGIPGLSQLPILGRLFSNDSGAKSKTEVVLLITPHVVRNIVRPEAPLEEFSSGTEAAISLNNFEINKADVNPEPVSQTSKPVANVPTENASTSASVPAATPLTNVEEASSYANGADQPLPLGSMKLGLAAPSQVKVGQVFEVEISAVAEKVQNALLSLVFNSEKFQIVKVEEGDLFRRSEGKSQFMHQIQDKTGRVSMSIIRQGNINGSGGVAKITFRALAATEAEPMSLGAANFTDEKGRVLPMDKLPGISIKVIR